MRSSLFALVGACGLLGCVSFPSAHLLQGPAALDVVTGPVVCGPVGFRQVPLQSRWGEYVRVTVAAPSALRGTVLVHANGVAQEARGWSTEASALILEARFPNESVERPFALERERPIDITLTGLEALGGGTCEGAVFTVEHGTLRPSIDERAWIAELERRGGPELAARREAARLEVDARRQAHYAQWAARHVEVSAEVLAQASAIREAHYAQWDARHVPSAPTVVAAGRIEAQVVGGGEVVAQGGSALGAPAHVSGAVVVRGGAALVSAGAGSSTVCAAPALVSGGVVVEGASSPVFAGAGSTTVCASPTLVSGGVVVRGGASGTGSSVGAAPALVSGDVLVLGGPSGAGSSTVGAAPALISGTSSVVVTGASPLPDPLPRGGEGGRSVVAVGSPGEWSQPPEARLRATASVESGWVQPFEPRLEPVAVSTESRVATALPAPPDQAPRAAVVPVETVEPAVGMLVPALFQLMFNVAAASPPPVHAAQPIPPRPH